MALSTKKTRPRLTFEIYIPEQAAPISKMMQAVDVLRSAKPDFVLATADHRHGTGLERAVEFASMVQSEAGIPGAVLIPSICYTRTRLKLQLQQMKRRGITRILAVRGDGMRPDFEHADFPSAAELIEFITVDECPGKYSKAPREIHIYYKLIDKKSSAEQIAAWGANGNEKV